jgi:predicted transcriptional regulator
LIVLDDQISPRNSNPCRVGTAIRSSDYVVCLDCGYRAKTLRRHISTQHGLSRDDR